MWKPGLQNLSRPSVLTIIIVGAVFVVDIMTPITYAEWLLYIFPLFIARVQSGKRFTTLLALICTLLTFIGFFLSTTQELAAYDLVNRSIGSAVFWLVASYGARPGGVQKQASGDFGAGTTTDWPSVRITLTYVVVAGMWITFSDRMLRSIVRDPDEFMQISEVKGWVFVILTGTLLYVLLHRYVASRFRTEAALRESEERNRLLFANTVDGIIVTSPDGTLLSANNAACTLLGYTEEELTRIGRRGILDHADELVLDALRQREKTGKFEGVLEFLRKDGRKVPCEVSTALFANHDGRKLGNWIIRDISERRRFEDAIRESEERLRLALSATNQGMYDLNLRTGEAIVNDNYASMLGYVPSGFRETHQLWKERLHPDDRERVTTYFASYLAGEIPEYKTDFRMRTQSGDWKWVFSIGQIVQRDPSGSPARMLGTHIDITSRKRAEESLVASEKKYRDLFAFAPIGIYQSTLDGWLTSANQALADVLGYPSVDELLEKNLHGIYFDPAERQQLIERYAPQTSARHLEVRWRKKDGTPVWIELSAHIIRQDPLRFEGFVNDITERKQAESQLRDSEQRYRRIVETANEGIWTINTDSVTDFANRKMGEMLGYAVEEMMGKSLFDFMDDEGKALAARNVERRKQGVEEQHEFKFRRKDGSPLWTVLNTNPIMGDDGAYLGALAMVTDITERRSADEKMRRLQQRNQLILQTTMDGYLLSNTQGMIVDANPAYCAMIGHTRAELLTMTVDVLEADLSRNEVKQRTGRLISEGTARFETRHRHKNGNVIDLEVSTSVLYDEGEPLIAEFVRDITQRKRNEHELQKLNRVYAVISQINQTIVKARTREELFRDVCSIAVTYGGFQMAWIGILDVQGSNVNPVATSGVDEGYLAAITPLPLRADHPEGRGPTATAIREGRYAVSRDIDRDTSMEPWRERALQRGYRSSIALPIKVHGRTIGAFNMYASEPAFFNEEEITSLEEVTSDIAFALEAMEHEEKRKQAEATIQLRLRDLEILHSASLAFTRIDTPLVVGQHILNALERLFQWKRCDIWARMAEGDDLQLIAQSRMGLNDEDFRRETERVQALIATHGQAIVRWVTDHGMPIRTGNVTGDPRYLQDDPQIRSELCVPLKLGSRTIGCINVESERPDAFTEFDEQILSTLANEAAIALGNARLFQNLEEELAERKRTQDLLQESEERFRSIFLNSPVGIIHYDTDMRVTDCNERLEEILQSKREYLVGLDMTKLRDQSVLPALRAALGGKPGFYDGFYRATTSAAEVWIQLRTAHIRNAAGRITGGIGIVEDVSERRRAEDEIRRSHERFELISRATNDVIRDWNIAGKTVWWNDTLYRKYGYAPGSLPTLEAWKSRIHPDDKERVTRSFHDALNQKEEVWSEEYRFLHADGTYGYVVDRSFLVTNEQDGPVRMIGSMVDVTNLKLAELDQRYLAEERNRIVKQLELQLDCMPIGCFISDVDMRLTDWNPACEQIFGFTKEDAIGNNPFDMLVPEEAKKRVVAIVDEIQSKNTTVRQVNHNLKKNGSLILCEWYNTPLRNEKGDYMGMMAMVEDVTEREKAKEELLKSNKQLRLLSAHLQSVREEEQKRISMEIHDELGQQLTALKIEASLIEKAATRLDKKIESGAILSHTHSLNSIIDTSIGTVRRIATELRPGVLDRLGIAEALQWQAMEFQKRSGITCTFASDADHEKLSDVIATAIFRIFQEALTNVARHAGASHVSATLAEHEGVLELQVRDNGRGITRKEIANTTSLGLLGISERAGMLGGTAAITGMPGKGTTVVVRIPLEKPH